MEVRKIRTVDWRLIQCSTCSRTYRVDIRKSCDLCIGTVFDHLSLLTRSWAFLIPTNSIDNEYLVGFERYDDFKNSILTVSGLKVLSVCRGKSGVSVGRHSFTARGWGVRGMRRKAIHVYTAYRLYSSVYRTLHVTLLYRNPRPQRPTHLCTVQSPR